MELILSLSWENDERYGKCANGELKYDASINTVTTETN